MKFIFSLLLSAFCFASLAQTNYVQPGQILWLGSLLSPVPTAGVDITRTGLIIEWAMDEETGTTVSNKARATSNFPAANIWPASENYFKTTDTKWMAGYSQGSPTITDRYTNDPNGIALNASRWVAAASANALSASYPITTEAGSYTTSVYLKSNAGTNQTARLGYYTSGWNYSSDFTVTTSWQRFDYTFTPTAGSARYVAFTVNGSAGAAADLLIWGAQLEKAAAASTYSTIDTNWNANIGRLRNSTTNNAPLWTNYGLSFPTASTRYAGGFGNQWFTNATVYSVFRRTGALGFLRYAPLVGDLFNYKKLSLFADDNTGKAVFYFNNTAVSGDNSWNDGLWHIATGVYDSTTLRLYIDGALAGIRTNSLSAVQIRELNLGNANDVGYFAGDMAYALVYTNAHSEATIRQNNSALAALVTDRSLTLEQLPNYVVVEGDSRMMFDDSFVRLALTNLAPDNVHAGMFAVSGSTLSSVTNRSLLVDSVYGSGTTTNILTLLIGVNDFVSIAPTNYVAQLKDYCQARQSVGYKVILCTELPSNRSNWNTNRDTLNILIKADNSFYDELCDLAADPTMGPYWAQTNTLLYSDGVHPTVLGATILSTNLAASLRKFIP